MLSKIIKSKGLEHNSYFIADGEEASVIDPRRDCWVYTQLARSECVKIKYKKWNILLKEITKVD